MKGGASLARTGAGCQCKIPGNSLFTLLDGAYTAVGVAEHPMQPAEDSAHLSNVPSDLLVSCDLATLVGTDSTIGGRIAALHSASDIYASGGVPLWGLSIVVLPQERTLEIGTSVLVGILEGAKMCSIAVVGGQTIYGSEPMAGMAVLGTLRSTQPMRKRSAQAGDYLYLSKPLGTSLALRASAMHAIQQESAEEALTVLTTSNEAASIAAVSAGVVACTDVSGFGFLGHVCQLLADGAGATIRLTRVPVIHEVTMLPEAMFHAPWFQANLEYAQSLREVRSLLPFHELGVLLDPQTNGGLLVSTNASNSEPLVRAGFVQVGEVVSSNIVTIEY